MASPHLVVGLGNPGAEYQWTRHNLGFRVLDGLAQHAGVPWHVDQAAEAWVTQATLGSWTVVLAKPKTFMNRSGHAASALCRRLLIDPSELLVAYDDADLELGRLRIRPRGTAGGHNGLQSLIDVLGTVEIPRLRLGVRGAGRPNQDLADYVLTPFEPDEIPAASNLIQRAVEAVGEILEHGLTAAMNRRNAPPLPPEGQG